MSLPIVFSDEQIRSLFQKLSTELNEPNITLRIERYPMGAPEENQPKFIADAFSDPRVRIVTLTINEHRMEQLYDDDLAIVLIHEILHHKYPNYSEKVICAEEHKVFERLYGKPFPQDIKEIVR